MISIYIVFAFTHPASPSKTKPWWERGYVCENVSTGSHLGSLWSWDLPQQLRRRLHVYHSVVPQKSLALMSELCRIITSSIANGGFPAAVFVVLQGGCLLTQHILFLIYPFSDLFGLALKIISFLYKIRIKPCKEWDSMSVWMLLSCWHFKMLVCGVQEWHILNTNILSELVFTKVYHGVLPNHRCVLVPVCVRGHTGLCCVVREYESVVILTCLLLLQLAAAITVISEQKGLDISMICLCVCVLGAILNHLLLWGKFRGVNPSKVTHPYTNRVWQ